MYNWVSPSRDSSLSLLSVSSTRETVKLLLSGGCAALCHDVLCSLDGVLYGWGTLGMGWSGDGLLNGWNAPWMGISLDRKLHSWEAHWMGRSMDGTPNGENGPRMGSSMDGMLTAQGSWSVPCSLNGLTPFSSALSHLCPRLLSTSTAERLSIILTTVFIEIKNIIHESPSAHVGLGKHSALPPPAF